jgi:ComF family protein
LCHRTNFLLVAPSAYSNTYAEILIQDLKFKYIKSAALPLAHMILQSLSSVLEEIPFDISRTLLVPVPLAMRRERERGFNQSALIAKEINALIPQLIYTPEILVRTRYELPQSKTCTREEREAHLKNVFLAHIPPEMKGLPIFLIDDVYTTGATIRNAIIELKNKGAGKIIVLVAAKT